MELGLGTVQFGQNYGATNTVGKTPLSDVEKILTLAGENNIRVLDTAPAYGDSEAVLGTLLAGDTSFRIITKAEKIADKTTEKLENEAVTVKDVDRVLRGIETSLKTLRRSSLDTVLMHQPEDWLKSGGELLYQKLSELKEQGVIQKLGVSIYEAGELDRVLARYPLDLVQAPLNVLDQRLVQSEHLVMLKEKNIEVHARSLFLQGVLLSPSTGLASGLQGFSPALASLDELITAHSLTRLSLALGFVQSLGAVDVGLVGVNTVGQFQEILDALDDAKYLPQDIDFKPLALSDLTLIDPRQWSSLVSAR